MLVMIFALGAAAPAFAGVSVSAPMNNSVVATTVQFVATATTACAKGVSAMGIYTAPNVLAYTVNGASLNTELTLNPGTYQTVVQEWDNCGGVSKTNVTIVVKGNAAEVQVMAPANNASVSTQVQYVATAHSGCTNGVAAMGIYTSPGVLAYTGQGASLNTVLRLNPGTYSTVVQEWDNCGGSAKTPVTINVAGTLASGGGSVQVAAPANNSNVAPSVQFVASATTACKAGVAAMGIYPAPGVLAYKVNGSSLNTVLTLAAGTYHTVVQEWDNCGGTATAPVAITVGSGGPAGSSGQFANLHQKAGWTGYALLPPLYNICSFCQPSGPQTTWAMIKGVSSPALSGSSSRMDVGGQTLYSDVLWNNHLIGDFSSQGLPDTNRSIVPNVHNFTYDVYFYATDIGASQALEFDINQFVNGQSFIWGHECRIGGGNEWDIWDNPGQKWHPTGIPCNPINNSWNHLVIQAQRTSDNHLLFKSITLNGQTANLNYYESPTPTNWYGITVNYQQDGNYKQQPYSIWLDRLMFSYW
jgi:major membrane immunogen (membrane-anchored lipoprotein)